VISDRFGRADVVLVGECCYEAELDRDRSDRKVGAGKWRSPSGCHLQANRMADDRVFGKIAAGNWTILFRDPEDDRYWELTYPKGELQGAGPQRLTALSPEKAHARCQFTGPAPSNNS
jgi:hypothetical protein